jgi:hypothetical protein
MVGHRSQGNNQGLVPMYAATTHKVWHRTKKQLEVEI